MSANWNSCYDRMPIPANCIKCHPLFALSSIILLSFLIAYFYVSVFKYGYQSYVYNAPGQIAVDDVASDLSTFLCHSYNVTPKTPADVFLVVGKAQVDFNNRSIVSRHAIQLFPASLQGNAFYLLEGSEITISACVDSRISKEDMFVLLFRGDNSWNYWKEGMCENCEFERIHIDSNCSEGHTESKYTVKQRDTYYVTITQGNNPNISNLDVTAILEVNRTSFDTCNALQSCYASTECLLNLEYLSDVDIVLKFDDTTTISFGSQCLERIIPWVELFVILPCVIIIFVSVFYFLACRDKKRGKKQTRKNNSANSDRTKLVSSEFSPECYRSMVDSDKL